MEDCATLARSALLDDDTPSLDSTGLSCSCLSTEEIDLGTPPRVEGIRDLIGPLYPSDGLAGSPYPPLIVAIFRA